MSGNTQGGVRVANDWRDYDALHPSLREVVRRAPWNLATKIWTRDLPRDPAAARRALIDKIIHESGFSVLDTYGSDHPQAVASPVPIPAEWERGRRATGGRRAAAG